MSKSDRIDNCRSKAAVGAGLTISENFRLPEWKAAFTIFVNQTLPNTRLVGAVRCEEWSSRRYMEPSGIEALWERSAAPLPDPEAGQVDRARSRIIALAGLDWMEEAA